MVPRCENDAKNKPAAGAIKDEPVKKNSNDQFSTDEDERARQVAAAVAARRAELAKQKADEARNAKAELTRLMFEEHDNDGKVYDNTNHGRKENKQIRVGGAKGKEGRADQTRGKCAFKRPCTVGWKSQNQPLARGGGNRTPL
eukprot:CAMPEP_0116032534 /NCGR_PEP_ID=MMETSP0321-20121206/18229_1 /TAXON_ID=163516 /ORGANISM="Leptocylindrus danicus var. danicus, Strain B650" /LENGTH=142 /DNA_ID=CAMNT_0003507993 /DNA_START=114 /DNA_END=542 /DNA_ORIENTATION=-